MEGLRWEKRKEMKKRKKKEMGGNVHVDTFLPNEEKEGVPMDIFFVSEGRKIKEEYAARTISRCGMSTKHSKQMSIKY